MRLARRTHGNNNPYWSDLTGNMLVYQTLTDYGTVFKWPEPIFAQPPSRVLRVRASTIELSQPAIRNKLVYFCLVGGKRSGERR
jgi:hypothetical protein